jgi:acetyltransferase
VVNQGFNDADQRGKQMQQEIVELATRAGIRILGPNTLGVINSFSGFTTSFMPVIKQRVGVGLICQSGIHFVGPSKFSGMIGKGVDLGNSCDIGFYDVLKYYADDPETEVIAIHMEGLNQGQDFLPLAARVVKEKPIVVHKTGSSETGARAAMSHTGSMAGNYQLLRAALRQTGITFLEEGGQMPYAVKTLLNLPPMKGNRVAVITYSGGAGIMISDCLDKHGFELASLSSRVKSLGYLAGSDGAWRQQSLFGGPGGSFKRSRGGCSYLCRHCSVARVFLSECLRNPERGDCLIECRETGYRLDLRSQNSGCAKAVRIRKQDHDLPNP